MKKFTCLLVALFAIQSVYSAAANCPTAKTDNTIWMTMKGVGGTEKLVDADFQDANGNYVTSTTECGGATGAAVNLCAAVDKTQAWLNARLDKVKTAITSFGSVAHKFGGYITKINSIAAASDFATVFPTTLAAGELSGATGAEAQAFAKTFATPADYTTAFDNFKGQVVGCFDYVKAVYQKILCSNILETSSKTAPWIADGGIIINAASCSGLVGACNKVFNFFHKVSWTAAAAAYYNKKKDTTKTYTFPANLAAIYYDSAATIANLNTAFTNCGADAAATACVADNKNNICKAFFKPFNDSPFASNAVTFIDTNNPVSAITRRELAVVANTQVITIAETGMFDWTTTANNKLISLPTTSPTAFVAADTTAWSSGYVAPSSSSSSSTTTTSSSKNAKVLFGTVLSFLAVALLN